MELDNRILPGKRPLTCYDIEDAEKYIGKPCYICSSYDCFHDLDLLRPTILRGVEDCEIPFHYDYDKQGEFCLPDEWVKKEPKYRPFSIEEWKFKHSVGNTILYRYKGTYCGDHREVEVMYLGYAKPLDGITDEPGKGELVLGNECHGLQNLCDNYEIWIDGSWKPFGIEEPILTEG